MRRLLLCALLANAVAAGEVYFEDIRLLKPGDYLDLDNGGIFASRETFPGGAPELGERELFLTAHEEDEGFAAAVPPVGAAPWHRLRTNEGNTSWVQRLPHRSAVVIRFVTRIGGEGPVLPAPRSPFCRGGRAGIEIRFEPDESYARYRIERRVAAGEEPFAEIALGQPPFQDRDAREAVRYAYRVTGFTADGRAGIPAALQGTTESRGVDTGTFRLPRGGQFDLLLGESVKTKGDIELIAVDRNGIRVRNGLGLYIFPTDPDRFDARSPWGSAETTPSSIPQGGRFLVPLSGGGVARCVVEEVRPPNEAVFRYEAYGDASVLPPAPRLQARRVDSGVAVRVEADAPWVVGVVRVRDVGSDAGPQALSVRDGEALDERPDGGDVREYVAVGTDRHGRRSTPGVLRYELKE